MIEKFRSINMLDYIEVVGIERLMDDISSFSCSINPEIEHFVNDNAIEFAKKKMSITYLVFNDKSEMVAIFTLTHKSIEIGNENLSNSKRKKIRRYADLNQKTDSYTVSAFLIAQFGKNYSIDAGRTISGNELMELAFEVLEKVQHEIGGGIVYLECEDKPKLLNFYQNVHNGFAEFDERYSDDDNVKYIQLFTFI